MTAYDDLLVKARAHYGIAAAPTLPKLIELLTGFGFVPIDFKRYRRSLVDEFVDERFVVGAYTLRDPDMLSQRANKEEREIYVDHPSEVFDPLEFGEEHEEWTIFSHELSIMERLIVVVEHSPKSLELPGSHRVYGAGQWLREGLWAATGVVPRDTGPVSADSTLFGDAFGFFGRKRFWSQALR